MVKSLFQRFQRSVATFSGTDFETLTLWSSYFYSVSHDLCHHCLCLRHLKIRSFFLHIKECSKYSLRQYEITWGESAASADLL